MRVANRFLTESADAGVLRMLEKIECKDVFEAAEKGDETSQASLQLFGAVFGKYMLCDRF